MLNKRDDLPPGSEEERPDDDELASDEGRSQLPAVSAAEDRLPGPMKAMAEALRANAEALQRVDQTQRRMVERIERSDKSQQVVASTRALNETFRGLSEIQRSLLDAVLKHRSGGSWLGFLFTTVAVAIFAAVMGFLFAEKSIEDSHVTQSRYQAAVADAERFQGERDTARAEVREAKGREAALRKDVEAKDGALAAAEKGQKERDETIAKLRREMDNKNARLEQYLEVKGQADMAGALQVRNMTLERENRALQEKIEELKRERVQTLEHFGEKMRELAGTNPQAVKDIAEKMGLYKPPEGTKAPEPGAPETLAGGRKRLILQQLQRLFPDGDDAYQVIDARGLKDGRRFQSVRLSRYDGARIVGTLVAKEMVLTAYPDQDFVEVKLLDGYMTNTSRPGEKIPLPEDGHMIYLRDVSLKAWLRRTARRVVIGEKGMLTWKATP